jgi:hypothetical protein
MATVMAPQARLSAERRFYSGMALAMVALVFAGFAPSWFLRGIVHSPRPNPSFTPTVVVHGVAFTLWMLVFWAKATLVAAGRRDLHVRLGYWGMALVAALVPIMYLTTVGQVARANQPPFATPLGWTAVPFWVMVSFALVGWLGWRERRNGAAHKRLMLSAALMMMGPAIGRLPIVPPLPIGFAILNLLAFATFMPLFIWDMKTLGRLHWATKLGGGAGAAALALPWATMFSPAWESFAASLPGM